ncbi:PedC/BrcD family bacteriocin maturation disulfide isomerase [Lacticaseibacillus sp. BCRC 81376]|jgi:predicted bacteriocin transport accessory protein|nr:PedC/BrcD family bacteriocin maturation disulfide isomerase [Lacticaseibacillus sp. BCRC 81376]
MKTQKGGECMTHEVKCPKCITGFVAFILSMTLLTTIMKPNVVDASNVGQTDVLGKQFETDVTETQYVSNIQGVVKIDGWKLIELLKSKTSFYLFIGYKECPYCREFSKVLKDFIPQMDRPIYYIDLDTSLNDFEGSKEAVMLNILNNQIHFYGTPTFELLIDGVAEKEFVGSATTLADLQYLKRISMSYAN